MGSEWGSYAAPIAGSGRRAVAREVAEEASETIGKQLARQAARKASQQAAQPEAGQKVYRVYGGEPMDADAWMAGEFSGPWGRYWTPIDPRRIRDYRNIAGLPIENKGRLLCCEDAHLSSGPCSCADLVELMHAPARPPRRVRNPSSQQSKGRFLIVGELIDPRGIRVERAAPIGSNRGELVEYQIPNPRRQVRILQVIGLNPPF